MSKVIIATLYGIEPVMRTTTKFGADKLILILSKMPDGTQEGSLELIKKSLGSVVNIKTIKIDPYDIVRIAEEVTKVIDTLDEKDIIYSNVTSGRKTMCLGLLYASYCRINRIHSIIYVTEEENKLIYLPKMSYNLTPNQQKVMVCIANHKHKTLLELAKAVGISRGMLYRNIKEFQDLGLIEEKEGLKLTDAGRIAIL